MLQCLQFWWFVVRKGRGGRLDPATGLPHTTVSAQQASDWLLEKLSIKLDMKACQRALRSLVKKGVVTRQQERKRWGNHSYTYAPATEVVSNQEDTKVQPPDPERPTTRTQVSNQAVYSSELKTGSTAVTAEEFKAVKNSTSSSEPKAKQPNSIDSEGDPRGVQEAQEQLSRPNSVVSHTRVDSAPRRATGASQRSTPRLSGLSAILSRCLELGGFTSWDDVPELEVVSPRAIISRDGVRLEVVDGACSPLR